MVLYVQLRFSNNYIFFITDVTVKFPSEINAAKNEKLK
jgi:hypothetical protein